MGGGRVDVAVAVVNHITVVYFKFQVSFSSFFFMFHVTSMTTVSLFVASIRDVTCVLVRGVDLLVVISALLFFYTGIVDIHSFYIKWSRVHIMIVSGRWVINAYDTYAVVVNM